MGARTARPTSIDHAAAPVGQQPRPPPPATDPTLQERAGGLESARSYAGGKAAFIKRVMVATDGSVTAQRAVDWASGFAEWFGAELLLVRVVTAECAPGSAAGGQEAARIDTARTELSRQASELAGPRGRAHVLADSQPAEAIVRVAAEEQADVLVVGNVGMRGRKEFLLNNVPNRVSHTAACTTVIVRTTDRTVTSSWPRTSRGNGPPLAAEEGGAAEDPHLMRRAAHIAAVMARHGLEEVMARRSGDPERVALVARRFRGALEELGPTFCKLGQVLSTRPDLLPPPFVEELAKLQDHVTPMAEEAVVRVMEEELGVPWEDVFESIEAEPLASGTIAQVQQATLASGERVVVKVQRPGARDEIQRDLALLGMFAERTSKRAALQEVVDLPTIVEHLSDSLQRELDFLAEGTNMEQLRRTLEPYPRLGVPCLYSDYTTRRLLVMEEIPGCPIKAAPQGVARKEAARQLLESYYQQILVDGFFHADPHPGNLLWWDDRVYFLDFGMVGEIGPEMRERLVLLLLAFWQEDAPFLTDVTLTIAGHDQRSDLDVEALRADMGALMARYRHLPLCEIQLGPVLQEMTTISLSHGVPLPASLVLAAKAMAQMQLATADLDPELDPFSVAGSFLARRTLERWRSGANLQRLFYESQKMGTRLVRMVESLERLTGARPGPKLQVHFRGVEGLETHLRRAGRRLSIALVTVGAFGATAVTATSPDVASWLPQSFGALGSLLTAGLLADLLRSR